MFLFLNPQDVDVKENTLHLFYQTESSNGHVTHQFLRKRVTITFVEVHADIVMSK